jgi:hydroxymethylpyrimidine pyrophosphatase-like HAD family hydrolase
MEMQYVALACDYDGTLASEGIVPRSALDALDRLRRSGRKLILVTGRELDDLQRVFPELDRFDRVVAENGALLYRPKEKEAKPLADPPAAAFIDSLRGQGVAPLSVGAVIVATWQPNETIVLETIRRLGLELQIIFNKGAVMVLPAGVNKSTGLAAALDEVGLSPHNVVGIGDAENDHAFLTLCGFSAAPANALPMVKEAADLVTAGARGAGVEELIGRMLAGDLAGFEAQARRQRVLLGKAAGESLLLPRSGGRILLAGTSGSGKSTLVAGLLERLAEAAYQFCVVDPEGDYAAIAGALKIGDSDQPPKGPKVLELLENPHQSVVANLLSIKLDDRPDFLAGLLPALQQLQVRTARPHWLFIDEAHHLLPEEWQRSGEMDSTWPGLFLITVHPDKIARPVLAEIDTLIVLGQSVGDTLARFRSQAGWPPAHDPPSPAPGQALLFRRGADERARLFEVAPPKAMRHRHLRKYAEGKLGDDKSFYFRGPEGRLNLRAHNLELFMQMADGVDDATWIHHLRAGDYSRWFRAAIKDGALADATAAVEADAGADPAQSRARIRQAIEQRYTGTA